MTSKKGKVTVNVVEARNILALDSNGKSDPFVMIKFNKDKRGKKHTKIQFANLNPKWDETFTFASEEPQTDKMKFDVWDFDKYSTNDFAGQCVVPVIAVYNRDTPLDEWFPLLDKGAESKSHSKKDRGEIHLIITWTPDVARHASPSTSSILKSTEHWEIDYNDLHLEKELGRGAFGIVYRGKWRFQDVAVKLLLNQKMSEKEIEDFRKEIELMMNLRPHRNVVPLMGVCINPQKPFCLITDFVENSSLEKLIKSNYIIPWKMVLDISKGIQAGVFHLHQENILHRDLAARNILLRANYEPLIADFGLSKKVDKIENHEKNQEKSHEKNRTTQQSQTTETSEFRGPYKWMAPESLKRAEFSVKSDAYSYGVVLYEIISRQEPYPTMTIYEVAQRVTNENMKLIVPPSTPPKFAQLMISCWESDPAKRPDFQQIGDRLAEIEKEIRV